jgi:FkbM family methyltransferase
MERAVTIGSRTFRVHASSLTPWQRLARAAMAASSTFRNESFWGRVASGRTEAGTFAAIERLLDPDGTFLDLGAWIGAMTLYAAGICRRCFAVEPDPLAFAQLSANLALNPDLAPRVVACNEAIWDRTGPLPFGTASTLGDSQSSALFTSSSQTLTVPAFTIEDFVSRHQVRGLSFIKIDIEGGEATVLPAMERFLEAAKPSLYVSLHPALFPHPREDAGRIIAVLSRYRRWWSPGGRPLDASRLLARLRLKLNYDLVVSDRG